MWIKFSYSKRLLSPAKTNDVTFNELFLHSSKEVFTRGVSRAGKLRVCLNRHLWKSCRSLEVNEVLQKFWVMKFCISYTETQCYSMRKNLSYFRKMLSYFKDHFQVNSLYHFKWEENAYMHKHAYIHIDICMYIFFSVSSTKCSFHRITEYYVLEETNEDH